MPLLEGHIHAIVDVCDIGNRPNGLLQELFEVVRGNAPRNDDGAANRLDLEQMGPAAKVRMASSRSRIRDTLESVSTCMLPTLFDHA